jgi:hypothetical protein
MAPQVTWFKQIGAKYTPDLVIQLVYGSMSVPDITQPRVKVDVMGYLIPGGATSRSYWRDSLKQFATIFYGWTLWTMLDSAFATAQHERVNKVRGAGREINLPALFSTEDRDVIQSLQVYKRLFRAAHAAGARLLVVFLPLSYSIHEEDQLRWLHLGVVDVGRQEAFNTAFVRYLDGLMPCIDLTAELRESAQSGQRMYFWLDIHWTAAANAAAARAVADYVAKTFKD